MEPRQRSFLGSMLVGVILLALVFKFVIEPIREKPERQRHEQQQERAARQAQARKMALERTRNLELGAREKWRADINTARATGPSGITPPLVTVHRNDAGEFVIGNVSGHPICVRVARVSSAARCQIGEPGRCQKMAPGEEREFLTRGRDREPCRSRSLEFRIGTETTSELPWWTDSALEEYDRVTALLEEEYARALEGRGVGALDAIETDTLRGEARGFEAFLADTSVAERWKEILEPLREAQMDRMLAEQ